MNTLVGLGSSTPDEAALVLNGVFCGKAFVKLLHNDAKYQLALILRCSSMFSAEKFEIVNEQKKEFSSPVHPGSYLISFHSKYKII